MPTDERVEPQSVSEFAIGDLGPLAWVLDGVRKSIQTAARLARHFAHEAENQRGANLESVDASPLLMAGQQLHQVAGVLEMVGQPLLARIVRGMEALVQDYAQRPQDCTSAAASSLEKVGFALVEFIEAELGDSPSPALALFPQWRQVCELAGGEPAHPADLWDVPWRWLDPGLPAGVAALEYDADVRARFDEGIRAILRHADAVAASTLAGVSCGLAVRAGAGTQAAIFWRLCAGFFEALAAGLIPVDLFVKRTASQVLLQYSTLARGDVAIPQPLARELLFFCAQACPREGQAGPHLVAVRQTWGLERHEPFDYGVPVFGLHDPAVLSQARRRVEAIKENWSALAGGDLARLKSCVDQFGLVGQSLRQLHEASIPLAQALEQVGQHLQQTGRVPRPELAMETATALLFLEAALARFQPRDATFAARMQELAARLDAARTGAPVGGLQPWIEELYRNVSDRQTMGTVVGELRLTLGEVEQKLDQFFRKPANRTPLDPVPGLLMQMRGVLSVLGLDQAVLAVGRIRERVEDLRETDPPDSESWRGQAFDNLAASLGVMGFLIDTLSYQPVLARTLFYFDEASEQFRFASGVAVVRPQAVPLAPAPAGAAAHASATPAAGPPLPGESDEDLRAVFLEEVREVLASGAQSVAALADDPADAESLATLRRAFHTLKGSSRMVGLPEFGAAAWSLQQLLDTWLTEQKPVSEALRGVASDALAGLERWAGELTAGLGHDWQAAPFEAMADALRLRGERLPLAIAPAAEPMPGAPAERPLPVEPEAPDARVEDFAPTRPAAVAPQEPVQSPAGALGELVSFELPDLELPVFAQPDAPEQAEATPAPESDEISDSGFLTLETSIPDEADTGGGALPETDAAALDFEFRLSGAGQGASPARVPDEPEAGPEPELKPGPGLEPKPEPEPQPADGDALPQAPWPEEDLSIDPPLPVEHEPPEAVEIEPVALDEPESPPSLATELDDGSLDEAVAGTALPGPEAITQIGALRISTPLYDVYLAEADDWSAQLGVLIEEWSHHPQAPIPGQARALAHSLAGSSATVGFGALSSLARVLERAIGRLLGQVGGTAEQAAVLQHAALDIRHLLHQFAAGLLKEPEIGIVSAVEALEPTQEPPAAPQDVPDPAAAPAPAPVIGQGGMAVDRIDPDLFPIFEEESEEILPRLSAALRRWTAQPQDLDARRQALRELHTLKGSARLAGAMTLGEMAHHAESAIEALDIEQLAASQVESLLAHFDRIEAGFRQLRTQAAALPLAQPAQPAVPSAPAAPEPEPGLVHPDPVSAALPALTIAAAPIQRGTVAGPAPLTLKPTSAGARQMVRVQSQLLDRLMAQAGEVMSSRARLSNDVAQMHAAMGELTRNVDRLRAHLRDVELQAEMQMQSRLAQSREAGRSFDPLEFDRFTRMQELTRMMAESVNDVATVQRNMQRAIGSGEDALVAQARQARELQRDLLRTRMVEFKSVAERLHSVVRQSAGIEGKQAQLVVLGGAVEIDRGILDRMTPAFEHLLRNAVVHGVESPTERKARGKPAEGTITIELRHAGNDVSIEFRDDGAGLNLARIRERALDRGLIGADQALGDAALAQLIFEPGFSTATTLTDLAGRGVGLDVVQMEVRALGGRIETRAGEAGGTSFRLVLPLTTAVTNVLLIRAGDRVVGVPVSLIELVRRGTPAELEQAYASGRLRLGDDEVHFFWAGALLQHSVRSVETARRAVPVVVFRSAAQRLALHVDEVLGNQEVVVKALGNQLSRLPGLAAVTTLPSGAVTLIYNPVALAAVYGQEIRALASTPARGSVGDPGHGHAAIPDTPLVLVVDDSITVRRVVQRLLLREGYRVALAADGLQGLEALHRERPAVVLSDIEMPRMDGFDFLRNIRADESLRGLPVVMITSRIADKHREHARRLGASHYLGKPYAEDELLGLVRGYVAAAHAT